MSIKSVYLMIVPLLELLIARRAGDVEVGVAGVVVRRRRDVARQRSLDVLGPIP